MEFAIAQDFLALGLVSIGERHTKDGSNFKVGKTAECGCTERPAPVSAHSPSNHTES